MCEKSSKCILCRRKFKLVWQFSYGSHAHFAFPYTPPKFPPPRESPREHDNPESFGSSYLDLKWRFQSTYFPAMHSSMDFWDIMIITESLVTHMSIPYFLKPMAWFFWNKVFEMRIIQQKASNHHIKFSLGLDYNLQKTAHLTPPLPNTPTQYRKWDYGSNLGLHW